MSHGNRKWIKIEHRVLDFLLTMNENKKFKSNNQEKQVLHEFGLSAKVSLFYYWN